MKRKLFNIVSAVLLCASVSGCGHSGKEHSDSPVARGQVKRPAVDLIVTAALGTAVGGKEWQSLAAQFQMEPLRVKGDDALRSVSHGIEVLSRQEVVWRVILSVHDTERRAYAGALPLGVLPDDGPDDLLRKLGPPRFDDLRAVADRWMTYTAGDVDCTFGFKNPPTLDFVLIQKVGEWKAYKAQPPN